MKGQGGSSSGKGGPTSTLASTTACRRPAKQQRRPRAEGHEDRISLLAHKSKLKSSANPPQVEARSPPEPAAPNISSIAPQLLKSEEANCAQAPTAL